MPGFIVVQAFLPGVLKGFGVCGSVEILGLLVAARWWEFFAFIPWAKARCGLGARKGARV